MSSRVVEAHREHLKSHRFVDSYDSGREYLEDELGFSNSNIASGYQDIDMKQMYRIHTDQPRDFLILQKNPNLESNWVSESVHAPHTHLSSWEGDKLTRNIAHSRTSVANYLNDAGGLRLKVILQSLADVFYEEEFGFETVLDQQEFEKYLRTSIARAYSNDSESKMIQSDEGFFNDFAYTNVMKFQGPRGQVSYNQEDLDWLGDELAAINPKFIIALGNVAKYSLKDLGFERTDYDGPFNEDQGKVYKYNGSDSRLEGMCALRLYHLQASNAVPHDILHDSLRSLKSEL